MNSPVRAIRRGVRAVEWFEPGLGRDLRLLRQIAAQRAETDRLLRRQLAEEAAEGMQIRKPNPLRRRPSP